MEENQQDSFVFISSQKGKNVLLRDGYRYNQSVINKNGTSFWRCSKKKECSASLTLSANKTEIIRESKNLHSCKSHKEKNDIDSKMDKCKTECCQKFTPVTKIFEHHFRESNLDIFPNCESKKDILYRARRKFLQVQNTDFSIVGEVEIPELLARDWLYCVDGTENEKIFVFVTKFIQNSVANLNNRDVLYFGDGTFKVPSPFYQLYSIHVDIDSCEDTTNVVPIIFFLLPNKTQSTYERMFSIIKYHFGIYIRRFKCDYEIAQINAFQMVFSDADLTGCYYHFSKAVWRKSVKLNVTNTKEGREITRLSANLPLLPSTYIHEVWAKIVEEAQQKGSDCISQFINYFYKQWIVTMNAEKISCYKQRHRTNNALEGWNRRYNARVGRKKGLPLYVHALRKEAIWQELKYKRTLFEGQKRKKNDYIFDKKYKRKAKKLEESEISAFNFLKRVSHIKRIIFGDDC